MKVTWAAFNLTTALALAVVFAAPRAQAQVTLTVSPAVVSNTYPGVITLAISGLTNGEKVIVQKWLDLNGNGTIDAGEPLFDAFKLVDNDNSYAVIGGVTNINVPFDINPAAGAISAALYLPPPMPLENTVGHYVFQVLSPSGRFAPVTASFAITNAPLPQAAAGTVFQADGLTPAPNALVVAQDMVHGNVAGAAVADSNGQYLLTLYPGKYALLGGALNAYYSFASGPTFTLTNGLTVTNALWVTNGGPYTVSGKIYDPGNSKGLGGMLVQLQSGALFEVAWTDTNGNYSAAVPPGFWKIQASKERLARQGYVYPQTNNLQVDATAGNVTNADLAFPRGNALVYGRLTDNSGTPFVNVKIDGGSEANAFDSKGYTDANGNYAVAILSGNSVAANVDAPTYGSPVLNYIWNTPNGVSSLGAGQAVEQDFVGLPAVGTITGHAQDNRGTNIVGVGLYANATVNGLNYSSLEGVTDNLGNYSLVVGDGQWNVAFLSGGHGEDNLDQLGYEDLTAPHSVNVPPTNAVLNLTVYPFGTPFITSPHRVSPTQFGFTVQGASNVTYTLQISTNLASPNWLNAYSFQILSNSISITDPAATNAARYYRIVK